MEALLEEVSCETYQKLDLPNRIDEIESSTQGKATHHYPRHDKVIRPHVASPVKTHLEIHEWEVLPHPPYSPDIAPSDFLLFRLVTHGLSQQHFHSYEEAKNWVNSWIASKDEAFFRRGIHMLHERWEEVVPSDGQYLE
ncbi:unnamed protein product [Parnassius mnemosyne]|uniref:Transposase n=1 Tax=Parnassius mnemosyne TaxID=213953 RepID=A0AAV1LXC3_9NEOP